MEASRFNDLFQSGMDMARAGWGAGPHASWIVADEQAVIEAGHRAYDGPIVDPEVEAADAQAMEWVKAKELSRGAIRLWGEGMY